VRLLTRLHALRKKKVESIDAGSGLEDSDLMEEMVVVLLLSAR
jgi:hypothetical protein